MKHVIVGTAGHIDHGKTALVKALTGQDADRLPEEKRRGITIDLGYAWCDLSDSGSTASENMSDSVIRAGFVDVPGHEKLIANMVSGVTGMDLVIFTVAADEGMMPQSFEHLGIMEILGVRRGIFAVTKSDTVDRDRIEAVRDQIRRESAGTFLENSPIIPTSVKTNEGLDELRRELCKMANEVVSERQHHPDMKDGTDCDADIVRLPVDRSFSLTGFGTVVTGTLLSGSIGKDTRLMVYPDGISCRVRSIQSYGEEVNQVQAGQRCALNLPKLSVKEAGRGTVIATAGTLKPSYVLDVRIRVSKHFMRSVESGMRAHLLIGTSRVLCRVFVFREDECYAQLRLEKPVCAVPGDRFILRFYSPVETIGGGIVINPNARKVRMSDTSALKRLKWMEEHPGRFIKETEVIRSKKTERKADPAGKSYVIPAAYRKTAEYLLDQFEKAQFRPVSVNGLDTSGFDEDRIRQALKALVRSGKVVRLDEYRYTTAEIADRAQKSLVDYLREHGEITIGEYRELLGTSRTGARVMLEYFDRRKVTRQQGGASLHVLIKKR